MSTQSYEVTYDICTEPKRDGGYSTRTDQSNLKMVVQAQSSNQARTIVESMFGGPRMCVTKSAYPKN